MGVPVGVYRCAADDGAAALEAEACFRNRDANFAKFFTNVAIATEPPLSMQKGGESGASSGHDRISVTNSCCLVDSSCHRLTPQLCIQTSERRLQ